MIRVVSGLIRREDGRFWVGLRAGAYAGTWEFPGGKVDKGEHDREALRRELSEELSIEATVGDLLCVTPTLTSLSGFHFRVALYEVLSISAEPICNPDDHSECQWMTLAELKAIPSEKGSPSFPFFINTVSFLYAPVSNES